ncbi:MAG: branched-chain amino acid aminotransferase [Flavobacteriaceae bacterium]|jgi:branched-chain amino acid aminotransferase|nr:branched-chain amino acid aminotransferase [Flavobacteriaceae bacterium]
MNTNISTKIDIEKIEKSRISEVDFENLVFGSTFTDHMFECDFVDGEWQTPKIRPYQPLVIQPSAKVFHYGQAVFEGMKAYKDDEGRVWLFRPEQNQKRINISAKRMAIPEFPEEYFMDGLITLLKMDHEWIKPGDGNSLYIRPFVMATEPGVVASRSNEYKFMIICSPVKPYYKGEVKVEIAQKYSRAADGGVGFAKAAGNYGAQFYPTKLAIEKGYQQVIWTDSNTHEYLEEAGTMNVFFRVNDTLLTAPTSDRILDGVTRKSIIQIAKDQGIPFEERKVSVKEIVAAAQNGTLKEIFGAGTAAVISPIIGFAYDEKEYDLPRLDNSYAQQLKKAVTDIQYNRSEDPYGWRVEVKL